MLKCSVQQVYIMNLHSKHYSEYGGYAVKTNVYKKRASLMKQSCVLNVFLQPFTNAEAANTVTETEKSRWSI